MAHFVVIDASAFVEFLILGEKAAAVEHAIANVRMAAPDIFNVEVLRTLRRMERAGELPGRRATKAVLRLTVAPVRRLATAPMLTIAWSLRANVEIADACYIAAARVLGVPLVTADHRLARAPGIKVPVITV